MAGISATTRKHGVSVGIAGGSSEYARQMVDKGFRLVIVPSGARLIALKAAEVIASAKGGP